MDRSKFIGGSDIAAVMGLSRWSTPLKLYNLKIGEIKEDLSDKEYIDIGTDIEEFIAQRFSKKTGMKVRRAPKQYIHKDYPYLAAQIDRLIEGSNMLLECKNSSEFKLKEWDGGDIPQEYILQVMWYLGITGRSKGYIAVLIGGNKYRYKAIDFDKDLYDTMVERAVDFWDNYVLKKVPPVASAGDTDLMKLLYPEAEQGKTVEFSKDTIDLIEQLGVTKTLLKDVKKSIDDIENKIKSELKDAEYGNSDSFKVSWKNVTANRVDTTKLKEDGVYENYTKESSYRKLNIKELKNV